MIRQSVSQSVSQSDRQSVSKTVSQSVTRTERQTDRQTDRHNTLELKETFKFYTGVKSLFRQRRGVSIMRRTLTVLYWYDIIIIIIQRVTYLVTSVSLLSNSDNKNSKGVQLNITAKLNELRI